LPGKIRTKNTAAAIPTCLRNFVNINVVVINKIPSAISTRPEVITTKSAFRGNQVGTWARNSFRFEPRWEEPAEVRKTPSASALILVNINTE